jgi:PST family polysaccharide transporter
MILLFNLYVPFTAYKNIFLYYFFSTTATIFLAPWLYTGLEKVKYISILSFTHRLIYVLLIFLLLRKEDDYIFVPILYSGSMLFGAAISVGIMYIKFGFRIGKTIPFEFFKFLKQDKQIYVSNIFANLYRNSNILILSLFASEASVGIYSAGEKIIKAVQGTFNPITQVFYPYISRLTKTSQAKSLRVIKYTAAFIAILAGSVALGIFIYSDLLSFFAFGQGFKETSVIMRLASPVILFGVLNFVIGIIFMTNYGMKRQFSYSVIIVGLLNLAICSVLSYLFDAVGAGVAFLLAEFNLLVIMLFFISKNKHIWDNVYVSQ